jgi:hypothetical protein
VSASPGITSLCIARPPSPSSSAPRPRRRTGNRAAPPIRRASDPACAAYPGHAADP